MTPPQKDQGADYFGLSVNFAVAILFFGALGWFIDSRVHTMPLFMLVGTLAGGVLGFLNVYWKIRKEERK